MLDRLLPTFIVFVFVQQVVYFQLIRPAHSVRPSNYLHFQTRIHVLVNNDIIRFVKLSPHP